MTWERHLPEGMRDDDLDLLGAGSLPAAWAARWAAEPGHPVVHDGARWVTAAELEDRSRAVAGRLAGIGLEPGDRVVTSAETSIGVVVAHVAALRLRLVVVPVNGAYREREVAHIARDARPRPRSSTTRSEGSGSAVRPTRPSTC